MRKFYRTTVHFSRQQGSGQLMQKYYHPGEKTWMVEDGPSQLWETYLERSPFKGAICARCGELYIVGRVGDIQKYEDFQCC